MDAENIQAESVVGATEQPKGETPKETKPLTTEDVQRMINEEVTKKERHFQSIADRDIKAANAKAKDAARRAEEAELKSQAIEKLISTNPQLANQFRNAQVQAQNAIYQQRDRYAAVEKIQQEFKDDMKDTLRDEYGIDPNDSRIDWADDEPSLRARNKRIMKSVATIVKAKDSGVNKDQLAKELEQKIRKELGIDTQDNTASVSSGTKSGLHDVIGKAKNTGEAKRMLDEYIKGA